MKKILLILCTIFLLTACGNNKVSETFQTKDGKTVEIVLDLKGEYRMTSNSPFIITNVDEEITTNGEFISIADYDMYENFILETGGIQSNKDVKDEREFISWDIENEYNYAIKLKDGKNALLLINKNKDELNKIIEGLTINES